MKKFLIILSIAAALASCSKNSGDDVTSDNSRKSVSMTGTFRSLAETGADLAFKLFAEACSLADDDGGAADPLVISPLSLGISLGMLADGADGQTLDDILAATGADSPNDLNEYFQTLVTQLPALDKTTILKSANSLWTNESCPVLDSYSASLSQWYGAETKTLDYDTAVSDINSWCGDKTDGLIDDLYSEGDIDENIRLILLNALYFKGVWSDKFDPDLTADDTFHNYDGSESTVPFMHSADYNAICYECDSYAVLTTFFGNLAYRMQILLPNEGVSLDDCIDSLSYSVWDEWRSHGDSMSLDVKIPKFTVKYKGSLLDALSEIGLGSLFDLETANFGNMSDTGLCVSDIKQETYFSIDEDGAKAATVTSSEASNTDPGPRESGEFHVDRPFLYLVYEFSSNTILFIGRVTSL